jgi:hypothetical protein
MIKTAVLTAITLIALTGCAGTTTATPTFTPPSSSIVTPPSSPGVTPPSSSICYGTEESYQGRCIPREIRDAYNLATLFGCNYIATARKEKTISEWAAGRCAFRGQFLYFYTFDSTEAYGLFTEQILKPGQNIGTFQPYSGPGVIGEPPLSVEDVVVGTDPGYEFLLQEARDSVADALKRYPFKFDIKSPIPL